MKTPLVVLFALFSFSSHGYTKNRAKNGKVIKWQDQNTSIVLSIDVGDGTFDLEDIVGDSSEQWNDNSGVTLSQQLVSSQTSTQNDVYFSSNSNILGSGVLGATVVTYYLSSGHIKNADILLNSSFFSEASDEPMLRDVVSHEIGHLLGLSHSEVWGATMFYSQFNGQDSLASDDRIGGYALYPYGSVRGEISGKIVGGKGKKAVPVFGAHVQALSMNGGHVVASNFSEKNGSFEIEGLPLGDTYYLWVGAAKHKSALPSMYANVKADFCSNREDFRGSFFQPCAPSDKGHPQGIALSSGRSSLDIGNVTIRCGFSVPSGYTDSKNGGNAFDPSPGSDAFVGFFTRSQFQNESSDRIDIDLGNEAQEGDYLEVKITAQGLYSVLEVETNHDSGCSGNECSSPEGTSLDHILRVELGADDEEISLEVTPVNYNSYFTSANKCKTADAHREYPRCSAFGDPLHFYFLSYRIVDSGFDSVYEKEFTDIDGNDTCLDGPLTYDIQQGVEDSESEQNLSNNDDNGGCGSIDVGGDSPGSGPFSLMLGFFAVLALSSKIMRRINFAV